jgi:tetratricopeptide (TPR) repeat protein
MSKQGKKTQASAAKHCTNCGAKYDSNDRFCRECGAPVKGAAKPNGRPSGLTGLRAFGLAIIALAVVYGILNYTGKSGGELPPAQRINFTDVGAPAEATTGTPAPLTPRDGADQLFNQALYAWETGDSAAMRQFVPMALVAYGNLDSLDPDARYHIALLHLTSGNAEQAIEQADTILAESPDHLLGLVVTARSYESLGRADRAAEYYQRFLAAYTPEVVSSRTEYIDHAGALPARRDHARLYLQERGISPEDSR